VQTAARAVFDAARTRADAEASRGRNQRKSDPDRLVYHLVVSLADGEALDDDAWRMVASRLRTAVGLDDRPYAVVRHACGDDETEKDHIHLLISRASLHRTDREGLPQVRAPKRRDYVEIRRATDALERELGLVRLSDRRRDGRVRDDDRHRQATASGRDLSAVDREIRQAWSGPDRVLALEQAGWIVAKGTEPLDRDRTVPVLVDRTERGVWSLSRALGVSAAEVADAFGDQYARLPSLSAARKQAVELERKRQLVYARAVQRVKQAEDAAREAQRKLDLLTIRHEQLEESYAGAVRAVSRLESEVAARRPDPEVTRLTEENARLRRRNWYLVDRLRRLRDEVLGVFDRVCQMVEKIPAVGPAVRALRSEVERLFRAGDDGPSLHQLLEGHSRRGRARSRPRSADRAATPGAV